MWFTELVNKPSAIRDHDMGELSGLVYLIFQGSVSHRDYDVKGVPEKPVLKKLQDNYVTPKEPLDAKSVHHTDYTKFNEPPRPSGRVPDNLTNRGR